MPRPASLYSLIIAQHSPSPPNPRPPDYRAGNLTIDWIDYHGEKEIFAHEEDGHGDSNNGVDGMRGMEGLGKRQSSSSGHGSMYGFGEEEPSLARRSTRGTTSLGPGIIHLFRHAPPLTVLETLEAGDLPASVTLDRRGSVDDDASVEGTERTAPDGEDGTLVAVLAVPEWMGFDVFGDWLGAWSTRLEGLRMIRYVGSVFFPHSWGFLRVLVSSLFLSSRLRSLSRTQRCFAKQNNRPLEIRTNKGSRGFHLDLHR